MVAGKPRRLESARWAPRKPNSVAQGHWRHSFCAHWQSVGYLELLTLIGRDCVCVCVRWANAREPSGQTVSQSVVKLRAECQHRQLVWVLIVSVKKKKKKKC